MFVNFEANRKQNLGQVGCELTNDAKILYEDLRQSTLRTLKAAAEVERAAEAGRIHPDCTTAVKSYNVFSRHPIFIHHAIIFKSRKGLRP